MNFYVIKAGIPGMTGSAFIVGDDGGDFIGLKGSGSLEGPGTLAGYGIALGRNGGGGDR